MSCIRGIKRIVRGRKTIDGAGVRLTRVLGMDDTADIDPFLMLDAFDAVNPDDYMRGFPMHPHRGIETFTYLIAGAMNHRDTLGNAGRIGSGEAQWMNAGSGILHEEMPVRSDRLRGLQLWINLPRAHKMAKPSYRDLRAGDMPCALVPGGKVRIAAGTFNGESGAEGTFIRPDILDISLDPDAQIEIPLPKTDTAFAYMLEGEASVGDARDAFGAGSAAILTEGDRLVARAGPRGARFVLFSAAPLHDPIAWGGPIVMNTQEELRLAFRELEEGRFIKDRPVSSAP